MTIQAIETRYAGCRFRSRLEARWAVFFDHLGIVWEYEPQGYALHSGAYLPDFWLPAIDPCGVWFEVKPWMPRMTHHRIKAGGEARSPVDDPRWAELAEASGKSLIVAFGMPRPDDLWEHAEMEEFFPEGWDNYRAFCRCFECGRFGITFMGRRERLRCHPSDDRSGADDWEIRKAYTAARSARFEHGEVAA